MHTFEGPTLASSCPIASRFYLWILLTGPTQHSSGSTHLPDNAAFVIRQGSFPRGQASQALTPALRRAKWILLQGVKQGDRKTFLKSTFPNGWGSLYSRSGCQGVCKVEWNILIAHRDKGRYSWSKTCYLYHIRKGTLEYWYHQKTELVVPVFYRNAIKKHLQYFTILNRVPNTKYLFSSKIYSLLYRQDLEKLSYSSSCHFLLINRIW